MDEKKNKDYSTILGGPSLESRIRDMYLDGKTEEEIAYALNVSLRYVHAGLKFLGFIKE